MGCASSHQLQQNAYPTSRVWGTGTGNPEIPQSYTRDNLCVKRTGLLSIHSHCQLGKLASPSPGQVQWHTVGQRLLRDALYHSNGR
jgi:hypothetical protein